MTVPLANRCIPLLIAIAEHLVLETVEEEVHLIIDIIVLTLSNGNLPRITERGALTIDCCPHLGAAVTRMVRKLFLRGKAGDKDAVPTEDPVGGVPAEYSSKGNENLPC